MWKISPLKHLLLFKICTREICEKFVYKHSEAKEYVKKECEIFRVLFLYEHKIYIFKSALVYFSYATIECIEIN